MFVFKSRAPLLNLADIDGSADNHPPKPGQPGFCKLTRVTFPSSFSASISRIFHSRAWWRKQSMSPSVSSSFKKLRSSASLEQQHLLLTALYLVPAVCCSMKRPSFSMVLLRRRAPSGRLRSALAGSASTRKSRITAWRLLTVAAPLPMIKSPGRKFMDHHALFLQYAQAWVTLALAGLRLEAISVTRTINRARKVRMASR